METLLITVGSFASILMGAGLLVGCFIAAFVFVCGSDPSDNSSCPIWIWFLVLLLSLGLLTVGVKSMNAIHPSHVSRTTANAVVLSFSKN